MIPLGAAHHPTNLDPLPGEVLLDPAALTRHAVCFGATGSGKTGLCVGLLESLALARVPVLALDPKGDLTNIALVFDSPEAMRPWLPDPGAAARHLAGLRADGRSPDELARFGRQVQVTVLTPGSEAGTPVDVLTALGRAPAGLRGDPEGLREYITGAVSALLGLIGRSSDPLTDPAAILLAHLLGDAFSAGRDMPLEALITAAVDPPFEHVGQLPLDTFLPREDRVQLARELNAVGSSPAFQPWRRGVPLDVGGWLTPGGAARTPVTVLYLSHLDDTQRMFFVTLLLHAVVAWSRSLAGSQALRALVYFDEVMGYLPPHPRTPPSKAPVLTLLKQARAVGVGVMLCTQNPVDIDYKALSNANTWLIGRLATRQDRARVADGLDEELAPVITRLPARTFLLRDERGVQALRTRHTLSLLRGPLTRREVGQLRQRTTSPAPALPHGLSPRWLDPAGINAVGEGVGPRFRLLLYGRLRAGGTLVHRAAWADALEEPYEAVLEDAWLRKREVEGDHDPLPAALLEDRAIARLRERWTEGAVRALRVRRQDVEVVGVVGVWCRAGGSGRGVG
jgi:hypothetical protein